MIVSIIAAMAKNRIIGNKNGLPWRMPADMRHFKQTTMGKPIIMGRRTFESFGAKPLPGRSNIIITRDPSFSPKDCLIAGSPDQALELAARQQADEVMVIGGATIYTALLPKAQRLYLTYIQADIDGDSQFPDYPNSTWKEVSHRHYPADPDNPHAYSFVSLEKFNE